MTTLEKIYKDLNLKIRTNIVNESSIKGINSGCDLLHHGYHITYEKYLQPFVNKKIKLCEIGILCGDKLVIFDKYFKDVTLYGYDINIDIIKKTQPKDFLDKINIKKLDSRDKSQTKFIQEKFDIIIDDGCHRFDSIKKTFNNFYEKLNHNGIYFNEYVNNKKLKKISSIFDSKNIKYKVEHNNQHSNHIIVIFK